MLSRSLRPTAPAARVSLTAPAVALPGPATAQPTPTTGSAPTVPAAFVGSVSVERPRALGSCPLRSKGQVVCAVNAGCVCPLAGQVSDQERAVLNDISTSASRLAGVLAWVFTLMSVALVVLLLLR